MKKNRLIASQTGFSILELLVAMGILLIISAVAMANVPEMLRSFKQNNLRREFEFILRRAKSEAAQEGTRTILALENTGTEYSLGFDYLPYNSPAAADNVILNRTLDDEFAITSDQAIIFDSRGYLIDETGQLTQTSLIFYQSGQAIISGQIFSTGFLNYEGAY